MSFLHINHMELLLYSYIIIIVYLLFKYSKSKTLYIFSPYIIIYLNFVFNDIVPFLLFYSWYTWKFAIHNIYSNSNKSFLFLYAFRKQLLIQTTLVIPSFSIKLNRKEKDYNLLLRIVSFLCGDDVWSFNKFTER